MLSAHLSRTETPPNIEPLYTTEQVARLLRVSQRCVQVWIRDGVLPGARCGRLWRIHESDLLEFVKVHHGPQGDTDTTSGAGEG